MDGAASGDDGRRPDPASAYRRLEAEHERKSLETQRRDDRLTRLRGATFVGFLACAVLFDFATDTGEALAAAVAAALVIAFVVLVRLHGRVRESARWHALHRGLAVEGLLRLDRAWGRLEELADEFGARTPAPVTASHPYARDLHVFGRASLASLSGPVTTTHGRRTLDAWLSNLAPSAEVRARQGAVRELASRLDFRHEMAARGRAGGKAPHGDVTELVEWAERPPWLAHRRALQLASWCLPLALLVLAMSQMTGLTGGPWWLIPLVLQLAVLKRVRARILADFKRAQGAAPALSRHAGQLRLISETELTDARLAALRARVGGDEPAHERFARLVRVVEMAESRRNPVYQAGAFLALLDVHVHRALERWKAHSGKQLRGWLDAIGEIEALSALATLAHDHPDWAFPRHHDELRVDAVGLGHPLLPPDRCVRNDVRLGPPGTCLLVTGSNMAGKSTLIRALGANVVLASAGAPVCAAELRLPDVSLQTSMSVQDSLEAGVSRFMAELLALKRVVDAAPSRGESAPLVLYLIDEMLQGTNSEERRVAARTVLRRLLESNAIGAITTHDLELAAAPDLLERTHPWHFRESAVGGEGEPRLEFDYVLRPGLATTRNALELFEMVGLGPIPARTEETDLVSPGDDVVST